jgi:hypothetical protein
MCVCVCVCVGGGGDMLATVQRMLADVHNEEKVEVDSGVHAPAMV